VTLDSAILVRANQMGSEAARAILLELPGFRHRFKMKLNGFTDITLGSVRK